MRKALTSVLLEQLKAPASGRFEVSDTKCIGLTFRLTSNGKEIPVFWEHIMRSPVRYGTGLVPSEISRFCRKG
jgi:hypothetical protein